MKQLISIFLVLVLIPSFGIAQDCVDYRDYLHWVGVVDTPGSAGGVAISGSLAFVADGDDGLQVIDISDPESLQIIGSADTPGFARGVAITETYAYIADNYGGLLILPLHCDITMVIDDNFLDPEPNDTPQPLAQLSVHPNPFNPLTTVSFSIDHPKTVELCIFDMTGKRIAVLADRTFEAGVHSMDWQGKDIQGRAVASGTYLVQMVTEELVLSEKMMLIR